MRTLASDRRGFTFVEALVTMVIIGAVTFGVMTASSALFEVESRTSRLSDASKMTISLFESIRSDPSLFQVNFSPSTIEDNVLLDPNTLPLAYRTGYFGPVAGCPQCTIRMGFVIRPFERQKGLFRVVIRMHDTTKPPEEDEFISGIVSSN